MATTNSKGTDSRLIKEDPSAMPLTRINFILMAAAGALIILGFVLMGGPGNDGDSFNPDIFSARRIVAGPTIAFIGFIAMGFGIMWKNRSPKSTSSSAAADKTEPAK